jgi:hypothetical protein
VIIEQRCDPRGKTELRRVLLKLLPKNPLRFLPRERRKSITTSRGDEIDLIVTVPVFEAMFLVVVLA